MKNKPVPNHSDFGVVVIPTAPLPRYIGGPNDDERVGSQPNKQHSCFYVPLRVVAQPDETPLLWWLVDGWIWHSYKPHIEDLGDWPRYPYDCRFVFQGAAGSPIFRQPSPRPMTEAEIITYVWVPRADDPNVQLGVR